MNIDEQSQSQCKRRRAAQFITRQKDTTSHDTTYRTQKHICIKDQPKKRTKMNQRV